MIPLPQPPKLIEKKGPTAIFEIAGLYPGYGVTIGNSLRRVLLSSLEGAAITQVKIENAPHEYGTLPGVYEDVMMILLNLKRLRFRLESKEPQTITLREEGEKEVLGKHFKLTSEVKLANPEQKIATITSKQGKLKIEAVVSPGIGYEPLELRDQTRAEVGVILLDAIYTPVQKVNFRVENMRVGKRTDFDRLYLEITTDGTITPEEALLGACRVLQKHYSLFIDSFVSKNLGKNLGKEEKSESHQKTEVQKISKDSSSVSEAKPKELKIEDLEISERVKTALLANGIKTVAGILQRKKETLRSLGGIGDKALQEIEKALKSLGFELN